MKLGIIGLSGAGKTTVFEALTGATGGESAKMEDRIGTITVPDERVDILSKIYSPQKTIFAKVEYFIPAKKQGKEKDSSQWTGVRDCDALIYVLRNFKQYGTEGADPGQDIATLDSELMVNDFMVVEKRLERLALDAKRGKKPNPEEIALLKEALEHLEEEKPLRSFPHIADSPLLKGYAFLSAKSVLALLNNEDEDSEMPEIAGFSMAEEGESSTGGSGIEGMVIRGKLEQELSQMTDEEAEDFLSEFNITASATDRVIIKSYSLLGLISFFTVGEDEVRAWTIKKETEALNAADVIHSDIKQGFIRAEVMAYGDLMEAGSYNEAKKKGRARLEGKTYLVEDGDIINFRFNV